MLYSGQYRLDAVLFQMIFELAVPTAIIMNSMGSKLASMIQDEFPHGTQPPILVNQLVNYLNAVQGIDFRELSADQHRPGCVILDHADRDVGSIPFMPVDMPSGKAMLPLVANPFPSFLLIFILLGQTLLNSALRHFDITRNLFCAHLLAISTKDIADLRLIRFHVLDYASKLRWEAK
jgi:hypothetical protein